MQSLNQPSKAARVTGYVLSTIATLFMLMDGGMKFVCPPFVVQASAPLGYSSIETLRIIGAVLLVFTVLYVVPRTAVLGAIGITGFLGGAVEQTCAPARRSSIWPFRSSSRCLSGAGCGCATCGSAPCCRWTQRIAKLKIPCVPQLRPPRGNKEI
jgi:DoxX-like protein